MIRRHTASQARDPSSHKTDSREDPSANRKRDKNEFLGGSRDLFESIADGDNQETNIKSEEKKPVKPDVGEYDQPEDIPDSELFTVLHYHIPKSEAVKRKPLLKKVAAEFGFVVYPNESDRPNNTDLRSRLNKYISQQIREGKLEEINGWEKVRRVT